MRFDLWTFGLQAVNFLVLLWLLQRFFYRPVLGIIAARRTAEDRLAAEAEAGQRTLQARLEDLDRRRAALAAERDSILATARAAAEAERKALLAKAQAQAEAGRAEATKDFERERAEAAADLGRDATRLAVSIVRRLLAELPAAAIQASLLEKARDDVRALPAEDRAHIAERLGAGGPPPQVITAAPLEEDAAERFAKGLAEALGAPLHPAYSVDPALIGGVEIHFPFTIVRRTLAQSLQSIQAELTDDQRPAPIA